MGKWNVWDDRQESSKTKYSVSDAESSSPSCQQSDYRTVSSSLPLSDVYDGEPSPLPYRNSSSGPLRSSQYSSVGATSRLSLRSSSTAATREVSRKGWKNILTR